MWWQSNTTIKISIHALLAESDTYQEMQTAKLLISIHALLAESDGDGQVSAGHLRHFYPRSPCGERQTQMHRSPALGQISIHALLAESDSPAM